MLDFICLRKKGSNRIDLEFNQIWESFFLRYSAAVAYPALLQVADANDEEMGPCTDFPSGNGSLSV